MIINVDNLVNGESRSVSFSKNISISDDYKINSIPTVKVTGDISNNEGKFRFNGKVHTVLNLNCDLCLEPFNIELNFNIDEIFSKSVDEENDYWLFSDKVIDLVPAVLSNILLNIPMKAVCSDKCKGLCNKCGHNLNEGDCGCDRTYINPKFEKLKALFEQANNEEEV